MSWWFQSTPPHGRRHYVRYPGGRARVRFNPRLRTGGDRLAFERFERVRRVSIHASAREATIGYNADYLLQNSFNPRLRTGGDLPYLKGTCFHIRFNPRLRTGGDMTSAVFISKFCRFQSTPPHGRRPASAVTSSYSRVRFNPRLRTGGDVPGCRWNSGLVEFQSTPPHGRRRCNAADAGGNPAGFNPRLRTGGDVMALLSCLLIGICFNPRLRTGGDIRRMILEATSAQFQSTPPHGRRQDQQQQQCS